MAEYIKSITTELDDSLFDQNDNPFNTTPLDQELLSEDSDGDDVAMNTTLSSDGWMYNNTHIQQPFSPFNINTDIYTITNTTAIDIISILFDEIERDTSISINHKDKSISLSFYDINIDNTNDSNNSNNIYNDSLSPDTPLNTTLPPPPPRRRSDFIERFKNQEKVSKVSVYICMCLLYITCILMFVYVCVNCIVLYALITYIYMYIG